MKVINFNCEKLLQIKSREILGGEKMSKFAPNKLVQECIKNSDIRGLKGAFVGIIFSDRSFSKGEFDYTLNYILRETNLNILESFDNGELLSKRISNGSATEDDFEEAVYNLKVNFCKERIEDVKKLGKALYGINITSKTTITHNSNRSSNQSKKKQYHQGSNMGKKKQNQKGCLIAGIVIGAAIVVGLVIKSMK